MKQIKYWLKAFRLRTLPLSFSSVLLGSFLAAFEGAFALPVLIWALLTTLFLQILSNLANDFGDTVHGVDNQGRVGPTRSVQSGEISLRQMKVAIVVFVLLSLFSGIALLFFATPNLGSGSFWFMFLLGIAAILAALKYTIGKKPYGYVGLGDFAVFLFFGPVGVLGTLFLHAGHMYPPQWLPATAVGLFSTGVLNLNNLRDRVNDAAFGKKTLVVKLGADASLYYHALLIVGGMFLAVFFTLMQYRSPWQWLFLLVFPLFIRGLVRVWQNREPYLLDPELKRLAIATLLFSLLFGTGLLIAS